MTLGGKLHVLHVLPHLERGGTQRWVLELIEGSSLLFDVEHRVVVLGARSEMLEEFTASSAVLSRHLAKGGPGGWWTTIRSLAQESRVTGADLLVAHSRFDRPYAMLAGARARTPVVSVLHSEFAASHYRIEGARRPAAWLRDVLERLLEQALLAGVVAVGPQLPAMWRSTGGPSRVPVHVSRPAVPSGSFDRLASVFDGGDELRLVVVARLVPSKHVDALIVALPLINLEAEVRLTIVGDGPERRHLERMAYESGVQHKVTFLGDRSDVPELLSRQHLFVLPTSTEGLGKAILEAAAAGLGLCVPRLPSLEGLLSGLERWTPLPDSEPNRIAEAVERSLIIADQRDAQERDRAFLRDRLDERQALAELIAFFRNRAVAGRQ